MEQYFVVSRGCIWGALAQKKQVPGKELAWHLYGYRFVDFILLLLWQRLLPCQLD